MSSNLVLDGEGNLYFVDIFRNSLFKITPDGQAGELVDLRTIVPEDRAHSLARGPDGHLYVSGYYMEKIWKIPPSGTVSPFYPFPGTPPRGAEVLHAGFDAKGVLHLMEWSYLPDPAVGRFFRLLKFAKPGEQPLVLYTSREGEPGYLDSHFGGLLVSPAGAIFLSGANRIWVLTPDGSARALAGSSEAGFVDGSGDKARFDWPFGMASDVDGDVLVAEASGRIRRVSPEGLVSTVAGGEARGYRDGPVAEARFGKIFGVAVDGAGTIYAAEFGGAKDQREYRIRVISEGRVRTLVRIPSAGVFRK